MKVEDDVMDSIQLDPDSLKIIGIWIKPRRILAFAVNQ